MCVCVCVCVIHTNFLHYRTQVCVSLATVESKRNTGRIIVSAVIIIDPSLAEWSRCLIINQEITGMILEIYTTLKMD